jgi:hypothetical protein
MGADGEERGVVAPSRIAASMSVTFAFSCISTPRSRIRWISASRTSRGSR